MSTPNGSTIPDPGWERALAHGSFEEVFAALEAVVARLEGGRLSLSDSVACYEIGVHLADRCERFLTDAELRVSRLEEAAARYSFAAEGGPEDDLAGDPVQATVGRDSMSDDD